MVWMTNQIAKMAFRQIKTECIAKPELADCIGVVIAAVFADSKYCLNGISLIDIVVARFLKWSPLLLGETGPDATVEDKKRLGFKVDEDDGTCETNEVYATRMQALAAGYVALAARSAPSNPSNPFSQLIVTQ
jgi:nucleoporin GLE1